MIPYTYKMVNLDGLDITTIIGQEFSGLYQAIQQAIATGEVIIIYNWYVAGIMTFYAVTPFCFRKLRSAKNRELTVGIVVAVSLLICQLFVQEGYWYIMDVGSNPRDANLEQTYLYPPSKKP